MSGTRCATGGLIDRSKTLRFTFDGKSYTGHPGDTLASALLAKRGAGHGAQLQIPPPARGMGGVV